MPGTNNINILLNKKKSIDRLGLSYSDKNTGKTDCHIALPKSPKSIHKLYPLSYKPVSSFSKGATNAWYGNRVIEQVVKDTVTRSEIKKPVTPHSLRHSIATHYIEQVVDIKFIQSFLGHSSIKMSERYTDNKSYDMNKIIIPIDNMDINIREELNQQSICNNAYTQLELSICIRKLQVYLETMLNNIRMVD